MPICWIAASYSVTARADTASEAELQYELGTLLYKQGKYMEAVDRFVASNRLVANASVVFNVAQTFAFLKRPIDAYNWYSTYLSFELPPDKRALGEAEQNKLAPRLAILDVTTDPSGAEIVVDRLELGSVGTSPRKIAVEPGTHRLIAQIANHKDGTLAVEAVRGKISEAKLTLAPIIGTLLVRSEPSNAEVRDEQRQQVLGRTPLRLELPVGELRLLLDLPGYVQQTRFVTVVESHDAQVEVKLVREAATVATLSVHGNAVGADVFLDRTRVGTTPLTMTGLEPGPRRIAITAAGRQPWSGTALFEAGAATRVDFNLTLPSERLGPALRVFGLGLGGSLLAGGAVTGAFALEAHRDFDRDPSRKLSDRVQHLNTAADILFTTGTLVLASTCVWYLLTPRPAHSSANVTMDR